MGDRIRRLIDWQGDLFGALDWLGQTEFYALAFLTRAWTREHPSGDGGGDDGDGGNVRAVVDGDRGLEGASTAVLNEQGGFEHYDARGSRRGRASKRKVSW